MAQYGGDQQYGQEVRQTDEYGNPVVTTNEYETVVRSADGARYEHEVTRTDEYGNIVRVTEQYKNKAVHSAGDYGSTGHHLGLGQADRGTGIGYGTGDQGLGTNIGHSVGSTGTDYPSGGRSTGQTGYQGLGTERGDTTGVHHGLSQADRGIGTGTYGTGHDQGLGTTIGRATGGTGTTDYTSVGRSTGQTGHQGLGTEPGSGVTTGVYQPSATPMGGAGIGTGTKDVYGGTGLGTGGHGYGDTHEKKGVIEKIKEKLPGGHSSDEQPHTTTTTTAGAGGGGYGGTHEKKGMIEKIKEKLPGHH